MLSLLFSMLRLPPISTLFPYTTLFRSRVKRTYAITLGSRLVIIWITLLMNGYQAYIIEYFVWIRFRRVKSFNLMRRGIDRKSTRLNSSHVAISYAVFCLKKKKEKIPKK